MSIFFAEYKMKKAVRGKKKEEIFINIDARKRNKCLYIY